MEYKKRLRKFNIPLEVEYVLCLSKFYKKEHYDEMFEILRENKIKILFGEDVDYFTELYKIISSK